MKKRIVFIVFIMTGSLLILYVFRYKASSHIKNGFTRKISFPKISLRNEFEMSNTSFAFAKQIDTDIVLKNYSNKFDLFRMKYTLKKIDTIIIAPIGDFSIKANDIYKNIAFDKIYLSNLDGDISVSEGNFFTLYKTAALSFDNFQVLSDFSLVVRVRKTIQKEDRLELTKLILQKKEAISERKFLLPKQVDGVFSADGWLYYDRENSRILYMYYYQGAFLNLDTNLNLAYKAKTIDTVKAADLKITTFKTRTNQGTDLMQMTTTKTPNFVNRYITTYKDHVYILSGLKADNETPAVFENNQPIDVYDIRNGNYKYSFYIPKYKGTKLNQFQIKDNTLVGIFGQYIATYDFTEL